ncbi:hypothetical protein EI693_09470 [Pseudomonas oryziphila]|uniref:Uncharacterized protein n=1 Tax=Pseudomonas oryziphila TaxID=2894079 RepID=A0ABN5TE42_9PSED|nr:hypothetical protein EI693_09470 [Pseudomonas oryziphila]
MGLHILCRSGLVSRKGRKAALVFSYATKIAGAAAQPFRDTRPLLQKSYARHWLRTCLRSSHDRAITADSAAKPAISAEPAAHPMRFSRDFALIRPTMVTQPTRGCVPNANNKYRPHDSPGAVRLQPGHRRQQPFPEGPTGP